MNMTDKMCTAIATFTYFITEILKCTELNKTDEDKQPEKS